MRCPGTGQLVICAGKATSRAQRPTSAGLKMFWPKPPKVILPTPMAKRAPMMMIHTGRFDGRFMPSRMPVRAAEPSRMVLRSERIMNLLMAHSKNTQAATLDRHTMAEPMPKNHSETSSAGTRAMMTPYMLRSTESRPWAWGESETTNLLIISVFLNNE